MPLTPQSTTTSSSSSCLDMHVLQTMKPRKVVRMSDCLGVGERNTESTDSTFEFEIITSKAAIVLVRAE